MGRVSHFLFNDLLTFNMRGLRMDEWTARRKGYRGWVNHDDNYTTDLCTVGQEFLQAFWRRALLLLLFVIVLAVTPINIAVGGIALFQSDWTSFEEAFRTFVSGFTWALPPLPEDVGVSGWEALHRMAMGMVYVLIPAGVAFLGAFFVVAFLIVQTIALVGRPVVAAIGKYRQDHPKDETQQPSVWTSWLKSFAQKTCVPIRVDHQVVTTKEKLNH